MGLNADDHQRASYETEKVTLDTATARVASANGTATPVGGNIGCLLFLNVTVVSGTGPTLLVKIETSDDGGTTWYDLPGGTFISATAVGKQVLSIAAHIGDTIRTNSVIGGTTPSFNYTVKAVL